MMRLWALGGHATVYKPTAVHARLPSLQKFNAMIYLEFRDDARIVHLHGCVALACGAGQARCHANVCCIAVWHGSQQLHGNSQLLGALCRPKMNHYLEYLRTGNCQFGDLCTWVRECSGLWGLSCPPGLRCCLLATPLLGMPQPDMLPRSLIMQWRRAFTRVVSASTRQNICATCPSGRWCITCTACAPT